MYVWKQQHLLALKPINSLNWDYVLTSEYQSLPIIIKIKSPNYYSGIGFFMILYTEYANAVMNDMFYYGLILGIIFLTLVYTFVMFLGIKERFYLYYFFYVLSFGIYLFITKINMHSLFNYNFPHELYFYSIPFSFITIFLLIYTRGFLKTNQFTPIIDKLILFLVLLKLIALAVGIWQSYPVLLHSLTDNMIILSSLIAGIARYRQGFKAARFFILSLCLVYLGMIIHSVLQILREETIYSFIQDGDFIFSFSNMTVLEIILFTIAISDRYRTLKKEKEHSQNLLIVELDEKQKLSQEMNQMLELSVINRTYELALANVKIQQMNDLLLAYNQKLEGDVTVLEKDKIMRKSISIDEFKKIFPSEDTCYQYLVALKWNKGYECKKCENKIASNGKMPYSQRCTKCGYEESATTFTIFYKLKFSIVKAFYILFLVTERKDISAQKIAEMILLRRQTCDDFKRKVLEKHAITITFVTAPAQCRLKSRSTPYARHPKTGLGLQSR